MNIIIVTSAGSSSGGARQALYLAKGLKDAGHTVHFVAPEKSGIFPLAEELSPVPLPRELPAARQTLESLFADSGPTLIHAFHNRAVKHVAYLGTMWRLRKLPVFCVAHRGLTARPRNPLPYLLPGLREFIVNSKACAKTLPLLWRKKHCHVVYNCLPEERLKTSCPPAGVREALNIPGGRFVLGTVANDHPPKGFDLLLRAYAKARAEIPPSCLVLVGATPAKWLPLCIDLKVEEHVRIVPPTNAVADFVRTFDLFVFASSFPESQPNVILEAMALDRPIIAAAVGGVPELLPDKFLFSVKKIAPLHGKLVEVVNSPLMLQASAAHSSAMKGLFAADLRLSAVLKLYENTVREKK